MKCESNLKSTRGFSLTEVLVTLGIFIFVIFIVSVFISQGYGFEDFTFAQTTAIDEAQRGVEKLVKEVREILPGDTGAYAIESADDFEMVFYADYDRDQAVEKVRYFLTDSDFKKGVTEATGNPLEYLPENEEIEIISRYVRNEANEPIFTYYNGDWPGDNVNNPLAVPANPLEVKLVHIYLKINVNPEKAPDYFHLESDAQIRNLKNNL